MLLLLYLLKKPQRNSNNSQRTHTSDTFRSQDFRVIQSNYDQWRLQMNYNRFLYRKKQSKKAIIHSLKTEDLWMKYEIGIQTKIVTTWSLILTRDLWIIQKQVTPSLQSTAQITVRFYVILHCSMRHNFHCINTFSTVCHILFYTHR